MINSILRRFLPAVMLAFVTLLTVNGPAYAYIDPGTGGMLLQLLLGGIAGALVVMKLYWHRLRQAVARIFGAQPKPEKADSD